MKIAEADKKIGDYILADQDKRVLNFIMDFIISSLFSIPFVVLMYISSDSVILSVLTYYLIRFLYYFITEYFLGKTFGKYETQTKVISSSCFTKPNLIQLVGRNILRFFSILSAVDDEKLAIHDKFSGTLVVEDIEKKKVLLSKYLYAFIFLMIGTIRAIYMVEKGFDLFGMFIIIVSFGAFFYKIMRK